MPVVFTSVSLLPKWGEDGVDSYSTPGIDPLKRASFGILRDLPGSLFLAKMTFSFPFAIQCKHTTERVQGHSQTFALWRVITSTSCVSWKVADILRRVRKNDCFLLVGDVHYATY